MRMEHDLKSAVQLILIEHICTAIYYVLAIFLTGNAVNVWLDDLSSAELMTRSPSSSFSMFLRLNGSLKMYPCANASTGTAQSEKTIKIIDANNGSYLLPMRSW